MPGSLFYPNPDPIPLPAPVWIFKVLHATVLSLHFVMVQWVLGWLLIGLFWNLMGRIQKNSPMLACSNQMAGSLPILMTYLINFGIPPLLFTQVLYGSFLYTSSILIGAWWISVIGLVILSYSALYAGSERAAKGRAWWGLALLALLAAVSVSKIYNTNMTLMLRPWAWVEMFRANSHGTGLPSHDPTMLPRWFFMLSGGLTMGGLASIVTGVRQKQGTPEKGFMVFHGGWIAGIGVLLQMLAAFKVVLSQPPTVLSQLNASSLYHMLSMVWIGLAVVLFFTAFLTVFKKEKAPMGLAVAAAAVGFLLTATMVVYRDGIRDISLLLQGYDVWSLKVIPNWPLVILFVVVFALGLVALGWMINLVLTAKKKETVCEEAAPVP